GPPPAATCCHSRQQRPSNPLTNCERQRAWPRRSSSSGNRMLPLCPRAFPGGAQRARVCGIYSPSPRGGAWPVAGRVRGTCMGECQPHLWARGLRARQPSLSFCATRGGSQAHPAPFVLVRKRAAVAHVTNCYCCCSACSPPEGDFAHVSGFFWIYFHRYRIVIKVQPRQGPERSRE